MFVFFGSSSKDANLKFKFTSDVSLHAIKGSLSVRLKFFFKKTQLTEATAIVLMSPHSGAACSADSPHVVCITFLWKPPLLSGTYRILSNRHDVFLRVLNNQEGRHCVCLNGQKYRSSAFKAKLLCEIKFIQKWKANDKRHQKGR